MAFRSESSPNKIICSKQASLIVRTNRSAYAFKFGDRGGSLTDSMPNPAMMARMYEVENVSDAFFVRESIRSLSDDVDPMSFLAHSGHAVPGQLVLIQFQQR